MPAPTMEPHKQAGGVVMEWETIGLCYLAFVYGGLFLTGRHQVLGGLVARPFSMLVFLALIPAIYPFMLLGGVMGARGKGRN